MRWGGGAVVEAEEPGKPGGPTSGCAMLEVSLGLWGRGFMLLHVDKDPGLGGFRGVPQSLSLTGRDIWLFGIQVLSLMV